MGCEQPMMRAEILDFWAMVWNPSTLVRLSHTLTIGLIVVAIGMPFALIYTTIIYWTFRGKTRLEPHSY